MNPELSVVMPCLNEAETLAICIKKAQGFFEREQVNGEVVIMAVPMVRKKLQEI